MISQTGGSVTQGSCVASTDAASALGNDGCSLCTAASLTTARGCVLYSTDGSEKVICSTVADGNKPLVTSCYVGTFSSITQPATASCSTEYCKVSWNISLSRSFKYNSIFKNVNQLDYTTVTAPVGSCTDTCTTNSAAAAGVTCCNVNNCNAPLTCYVGAYNNYLGTGTTVTASTYAATVCDNTQLFCKVISKIKFRNTIWIFKQKVLFFRQSIRMPPLLELLWLDLVKQHAPLLQWFLNRLQALREQHAARQDFATMVLPSLIWQLTSLPCIQF